VQQALRDAAEHQTGDSSLPTCAHHDQVRAEVARGIGKRVRGPSCRGASQLVARVDAGVAQFLDLGLNPALDLVLVELNRISARASHHDLPHVNRDEACGNRLGQPTRVLERTFCVLGAVTRPHDHLEHPFSSSRLGRDSCLSGAEGQWRAPRAAGLRRLPALRK
jgi:hypothetical protein